MVKQLKLKAILYILIMVILIPGCGETKTAAQTTPLDTAPAPTDPTAPAPGAGMETPETESTQATETWQFREAGEIQIPVGAIDWSTTTDLPAGTGVRYEISAAAGQQMTVWLDPQSTGGDTPAATLVVTDARNQVMTTDPAVYWSQVLTENQQYSIEVRSLSQDTLTYSLKIEIPAAVIEPADGEKYSPITADLCQSLQQVASESLQVDVTWQEPAPFMDSLAKEAGQGCRLLASGTGEQFSGPDEVITTLIGSIGLGWEEQVDYQAAGPMGESTALTRDMGLMLISAQWTPAVDVTCPSDQPISECDLTPAQQIYSIQVDIAQYTTDFSLEGHWEDATTGFSLDLTQEWKNISGMHTIVVQDGGKIDSLEDSIQGTIWGEGAVVQFQSSFTASVGTAEITVVDPNTIVWKITYPPDGEYYLPAEATLSR